MDSAQLSGVFQSEKFQLARELSGETLTSIANAIGVSRQFLSGLERGTETPGGELLQTLSDYLQVSPGYFYSPLFRSVSEIECHFRRQKTTRKKDLAGARAFGNMLLQLIQFIETRVQIQESNLPNFTVSSEDEVEDIAEKCRIHWGLGVSMPLASMARVLETAASVIIGKYQTDSGKIDAFSFSVQRGVVVRSEFKDSTSRCRFDFGHELGHLVMHRGLETGDQITESQANRFAGAFLVPKEAFINEFPISKRWDWQALIKMKRKWGIALTAIVYRAKNLGLIDDDKFRNGIIKIKRTWGNNEPAEPKAEEPVLLKMAIERILKDVSFGEIALALGWSKQLLSTISGITYNDDLEGAGNVLPLPM